MRCNENRALASVLQQVVLWFDQELMLASEFKRKYREDFCSGEAVLVAVTYQLNPRAAPLLTTSLTR
jgi:hypothetical protein